MKEIESQKEQKKESASKPWYKTWWGILFLLIIWPVAAIIWIWKKNWNKLIKITLISPLILITLFSALIGVISVDVLREETRIAKKDETTTGIQEVAPKSLKRETLEPTKVEKDIANPSPTSTPNLKGEKVKVIRVIDGDTIEIEGGNKIRYIGIDTPETKDPNEPVQCYGKEAADKNRELVEGKIVELEKDISETDKYGRLLRYIWIGNILVNETLVREGYAQSSTYPPDVKYQNRFIEAQRKAREEGKGLWSSYCETWTKSTPTTVTQQTQTTSNSGCLYDCNGPDKDCEDFSTHSEAQSFFNCCGFTTTYDPMRLDSVGVGNGIACESLP